MIDIAHHSLSSLQVLQLRCMLLADMPEINDLWDFDQPEESERRFREAAASTDDLGWRNEVLTQVARALGLQRRFDEGHAILDRVESEGSLTDRAVTRLHLERGRLLRSSGHQDASAPLFREAFDRATASQDDDLAVDAAHMLGIVSDPDGQIEWNRRAIEIAAQSSDPRAQQWAPSLLNNLGWTYHDMGSFDEAYELFTTALALREARGEPNAIRIAKYAVARTLRSMQRYQEALDLLSEAREQSPVEDGYLSEEFAENLIALGRNDLAKTHIDDAIRLLSADPWVTSDRLARLKALGQLGGF
ncbi:MAG: tetratricopeptide repeat protein [Fimbriimonadaceae bacterium]